ncbi:MAG: hypothetical protein HY926_02550 [Elusimicrobia bacterium]|nr:hypothetical protein [Elusimicrobiota bacterium]
MKSQVALSGSSAGLAAVMRLDTTVGFLQDREETIDVAPIVPVGSSAYVWRTIFHRRCA